MTGFLIGEGNGTPLQYSCLENPMDRGAWWAAICGVAQSQTWLKQFGGGSGGFLIGRENLDTDMYREKTTWRHRWMMVVYKPKTEAWKRSFPTHLRRSQPCQHHKFRLLASELWVNKFLLFKAPSPKHFAMTALAN